MESDKDDIHKNNDENHINADHNATKDAPSINDEEGCDNYEINRNITILKSL